MIRFGQIYLKCIAVTSFLIGNSSADIPTKYLDAVRNKLNYLDWAITANNKIVEAKDDCFFYEQPLTVSKYRESIVNVIGHAIADCVTMKNEFAERKGVKRLILFDVKPDTYTPENWNAVIAFNYIDVMINTDLYNWTQNKTKQEIRKEVFTNISETVIEHYKKAKIHIDNIGGKLQRAVADIMEYDKQLNLMQSLTEFCNARKFKEEYKTNGIDNTCYISPHIKTVDQITVGTYTRYGDICFCTRQNIKVNTDKMEINIKAPEFTRTKSEDIWFSNNFNSTELYETISKDSAPKMIGDYIYRVSNLMKILKGRDNMLKALLRLYRDDLELSDFDLEDEE